MNVLCTGNVSKDKFLLILNDLVDFFKNKNNSKLFLDQSIHLFENKINIDTENIYNPEVNIDFIISIGGDGTILSAIKRMKDKQLPILGIHVGNLGFLNKINDNKYIDVLNNIINSKNVHFTEFSLLQSSQNFGDEIIEVVAFNELYINRSDVSRLLSINVFIDDIKLNTYRCDGLIVSSPMGSTAYSLSAGGPIVSPEVDCLIITPVSPHTLSSRPIIVSNKSMIEVQPGDSNDRLSIHSDGQTIKSINANTKLIIRKSNIKAKFVNFNNESSYYKKLKENLGWNR